MYSNLPGDFFQTQDCLAQLFLCSVPMSSAKSPVKQKVKNCWTLNSLEAWRRRQHELHLQCELNAARTNLGKAQEQIKALSKQLADRMRGHAHKDLIQSPSERIWIDALKSHDREPRGRLSLPRRCQSLVPRRCQPGVQNYRLIRSSSVSQTHRGLLV
jgi:hypothetical protein